MRTSLFQQAHAYHTDMPGIIRATLNDYGLADGLIDLHLIGWDGRRVTKPLFDCDGRVVAIETYELAAGGKLARLIKQLTW